MEIKGGVSKCANCGVSLQDGQYSSGLDDDDATTRATTEASSSSDQSNSSNNKAISHHQKVGSITINVNDKEIEVPLSVALAEVFKLRPLFDGKTWEEVSGNHLVLCQACSLVFSKLYSLLLDFNCLRSADSFLAESIRCLEALITRITASQSSGTKSEIIFQGLSSSSSASTNNASSKIQQTFQQDESVAEKSENPGCTSQPMQVQLVATSNAQGQAGTTGNGPGYILINVCSTPAASVSEAEDQSSKRPQKGSGGGSGDRAVKCEKCGEECLSARALGLHRFRHHNTDNPFVCEICKKGFASIINLKLHAQRHSDSRPFECEFCGSTFKMKFDLKQHHHTVHAKDGLQLNLPNERGGKRGRMRLDQDHHTQIRQSSSSSSDIPSNQGGSLHHQQQQQQQQQNFSRPLPPTGISLLFKCTDCGEDFHSAMTLGVHRSSVHQAPDPYKCHLCWQSFPYSNDLRVHLTEHVNGGARNNQEDGRMFGGDGYQGNDPVQLMGFTTKSASSSSGSSQQPLNLVSIYGTSPSSSTYDPSSLLEVNLEEPEMKETVAGGSKD